jgi:hypothetical protein
MEKNSNAGSGMVTGKINLYFPSRQSIPFFQATEKKPDLAVSHEPDESLVELVRMGEVVEQGLEQGAGHHLPNQAPAQFHS